MYAQTYRKLLKQDRSDVSKTVTGGRSDGVVVVWLCGQGEHRSDHVQPEVMHLQRGFEWQHRSLYGVTSICQVCHQQPMSVIVSPICAVPLWLLCHWHVLCVTDLCHVVSVTCNDVTGQWPVSRVSDLSHVTDLCHMSQCHVSVTVSYVTDLRQVSLTCVLHHWPALCITDLSYVIDLCHALLTCVLHHWPVCSQSCFELAAATKQLSLPAAEDRVVISDNYILGIL